MQERKFDMSPLQVLFHLLRSALNSCEVPPLPPDIDWAGVFDVACEHGVAAIAQDGLSRLMEGAEECGRGFDSPENENVKYEWFGLVFEVESQNRNTGKRAGELSAFFSSKGFRSCVLKGQGLALLYLNPEHRQPGDIDLWVDGSRDDVIRAVTDAGVKVGHIDVKHSDMEFFPDVPVEIHFNPSYSCNPFIGRRLAAWTSAQSGIQFSLFDSSVGFAHPSVGFNLVYCLLHLYRHLFSEGVGLRQVVDYYCILKHSDNSQRQEAYSTICSFGMKRFASGMMWVLKEVFDMDETLLLCPMNEAEGRFLLNEFLQGAGFGRNDSRNSRIRRSGYFARGLAQFRKNLRFLTHYPQEVLWSPFWKLWHWFWRKTKGYL